ARGPDLIAGFDASGAFDEGGTTEEDEASFDGVAQGDSEGTFADPIGDLIQATPGAFDAASLASTPVPAAVPPAAVGILITSQVAAGAAPSMAALDQLALPVGQP